MIFILDNKKLIIDFYFKQNKKFIEENSIQYTR